VQFLCCELVALQQHAQLQPLHVFDAASAVWRQGVADTMEDSIAKLQQVRSDGPYLHGGLRLTLIELVGLMMVLRFTT
jgi:hypothetical protein